MVARLAPILSHLWRIAVALLTLEVVVVSALRYLIRNGDAPSFILDNGFANPFLILHVIGGTTALALGPLQFLPRVRARLPVFHRMSGRAYVVACAIAAPAGFMLALGTNAGPVAGLGFAIPAALWPVFTYRGWRSAVERRFAEHREWMMRSYAITSTAITLRLMLPLAGVMGFEFLPAYRMIAWASWITNLILCEVWLRRRRRPAESALAAA